MFHLVFLRCIHVSIYWESYDKWDCRVGVVDWKGKAERRWVREADDEWAEITRSSRREKKCKMITRMLQVQLAELQEQNALKVQQLMEIQKQKVSTLEEVSQLENKFAASVSFFIFVLYFLIFTNVFTDSYVIFIYI